MDSITAIFKNYWQILSGTLGLNAIDAQEIGKYLLAHYTGSDRHYHNARHIVAMLDGFERIKAKCAHPMAAELAIFFHDVIYDVGRRDNEQQSAACMQEMLAGKVDNTILDGAAFSIEATQKHVATSHPDTNWILDLDMAILGQAWPVYERYAKDVMQEHLLVYEKEAYRQGRIALFLEPALAQGVIFLTDDFNPLNDPAIQNMQREKDILLSGKSFA